MKAKLWPIVGAVLVAAGKRAPAQTGAPPAPAGPTEARVEQPAAGPERSPACPEPPAARLPEVMNAYVNLPYTELKSLWEAARARQQEERARPAPPPVAHWWNRLEASWDFAADGRTGRFEAVWDGEVVAAGWQEMFVMDGELRVEQAEAAPRGVVWRDGYRLLVEQPGKVQVTLRGATPGWQQLTATPLRMKLGGATIKRLTLRGLPPGHALRCQGGELTRRDGPEGGGFLLPAGETELSWSVAKVLEETPPRPSQWQVESRVLVRAGEGSLLYQARVAARADDGSGLEILLDLPPNANGLKVEGEDVEGFELARTAAGGKRLRLQWKTRDVLDREFEIRYAVPQSPLAETWKVLAPTVAGGGETKVLFALVAAEGMELEGAELRAVPAQRLGAWLREQLGDHAFVTAETGATLELRTRWLPVVATAEAVVSEAKARLRLVDDGSMQTDVAWKIRHQGPLSWQLRLPGQVELLSCTVAGRPAKPVRRDDGSLEFALPAPTKDAEGGTEVALGYVGKTTALDPVSGRVDLELPQSALFIEKLDWLVSLPARLEVTAVEGNLTVAGAAQETGADGVVALRKELCRGEKPAAGFFYQRKDFAR